MTERKRVLLGVALLPACLMAMGCGGGTQAHQPQGMKLAEVNVSVPITQTITDYEEFPGQTEAIPTVEIRPRVTGELVKACFQDGADVDKGALLFEIDPRPFQDALDSALGQLALAKATLVKAEKNYTRIIGLRTPGAVSQEDLDNAFADRGIAKASVQTATAAVETARLNLSFTKIAAPAAGRISRRMLDPGNMVVANQTPLTYVVALDPIYAYFDLDERTVLRVQRLVEQGKIPTLRDGEVPVQMALGDEKEGVYAHSGKINFVDNRVDAGTGTLRLRGVFPNKDKHLRPGLFVRVRLPIGKPHEAQLIAEQAIGTDQGQKFVYVVKETGDVEYRAVSVGRLQNGLREITGGLKPDEKVVVNGLQRIHPKAQVVAKVVPMPMQEAKN